MERRPRLPPTPWCRRSTLATDELPAVNSDEPAALGLVDLEVAYGAIRAVQGVSLQVRPGSITALVGSNGAGKSSVLRAAAGILPLSSGRVNVGSTDVSTLPARKRLLEHGVTLVPEGRSAFTTMTVQENLDLGLRIGRLREANGVAATFTLDEAFELFPVLGERAQQRAQVLSGGEQQMLAIARSLLMSPSVLLVDEPSMGLAPMLVRKIFAVMEEVFRRHNVAVLLVEQDTAIALDLAVDGYVLEFGRVVAHGSSDELRHDARLRQAYLGTADALGTVIEDPVIEDPGVTT